MKNENDMLLKRGKKTNSTDRTKALEIYSHTKKNHSNTIPITKRT